MALNLEDKKAVVAEVTAQVAKASTIVVAEYRGITVGDLTKLRAQARQQGVYLRVLKNTLARRAVEGTPFAELAEQLTGPLIYGISEDAVAPAKVLNDFAKGNDKLVILGGAMGSTALDADGVKALASLPSLDELRAKLVGMISTPATRIAQVVNAPAGQLARVFGAYSKKDEAA